VKIVLKNRLPEGVFAKDLALWIKGILSKLDVTSTTGFPTVGGNA
jgi:3-isopropylmalate/(R)-2-methylmalate dehydratase large subunit